MKIEVQTRLWYLSSRLKVGVWAIILFSFSINSYCLVIGSLRRSGQSLKKRFNIKLEEKISMCVNQFQQDSVSIEAETRLLSHQKNSTGWRRVHSLSSDVQMMKLSLSILMFM